MSLFKNQKLPVIVTIVLVIGGIGYHFYPQNQAVYFDEDVKKHYHHFKAKYNYSDCRLWIDYSPQRAENEFDYTAYKIIQDTILGYNKYMVYSDQKDFGGTPGIHLAFADFCEHKMELGTKISSELVDKHDEITSARAVLHTEDRNQFNTAKPFMPYLDVN